MNNILRLLNHKKTVIGMIHFPPLAGYEGYMGIEKIKERVAYEVKLLNGSGVHAIMIENNYDIPHRENISGEVAAVYTTLGTYISGLTDLPMGISVLWNDYRTSLAICEAIGTTFFRVPAFVDDVRTSYGEMKHVAEETVQLRKKMHLEKNAAIFADVQVKHSKLIDGKKPLSLSVTEAVSQRADAVIVTGKWTGNPPTLEDLQTAKKYAGTIPLIVGSGSDSENIKSLFEYADGIIVGTAIMDNGIVNKQKLEKYMSSYKTAVGKER
jgi:uncharacterized protein